MFTGIVSEVGEVVSVELQGGSARITVRGGPAVTDAVDGDSVSVNGCCLTVTGHYADCFTADVMAESLGRTSLGDLQAGSPVNLEPALRADGRLGGHLVQGHVDGTGTLVERLPGRHAEVFRVALPSALARYLVPKGSVTLDGVSLTVVEVRDSATPSFTVALIPTTLAATTLGRTRIGSRLNVEIDIVAKYVERLLDVRPAADDTTIEDSA